MKIDCKAWVIIASSLTGLIILMWIGFFVFQSRAYNSQKSTSNVTQIFEISKNQGAKEIGFNLEKEDLIKSRYYFYYHIKREDLANQIKAGEYELSPNMNIAEIVEKITKGEIKEEYQKLVVPEGFTNAKIVARLEKIDENLAQEFNKIISCKYPVDSEFSCQKLAQEYSFLGDLPTGVDIEGYLFPDTYFIYPEDDALKLVEKFLDNFQSKIDSLGLGELENNERDLHQILTLASIVEKEVRSEEDMKTVAGIFWKRVEDEYLLQSCATLAYILGEDKTQYSYEDTQINSVYNTYLNPGLPPGPVSNPGSNAIQASINPEENDYYYFLSDPKTGKTIFSKTLEEHNLNKVRYGL
jgi:UPF0755 protein